MSLSGTQTGLSETWYAFLAECSSHRRLGLLAGRHQLSFGSGEEDSVKKLLRLLAVCSLCTLGAAE